MFPPRRARAKRFDPRWVGDSIFVFQVPIDRVFRRRRPFPAPWPRGTVFAVGYAAPVFSGLARVSQDVAEALVAPSTQKARVTQEPVEVLVLPSTGKARITQEVAEALVQVTPKARVTQDVVEVLVRLSHEQVQIIVID
jgi:hypothetical protein